MNKNNQNIIYPLTGKAMFKTLLVEDNLHYRDILKSALLKRFVDLEIRETAGENDTLYAVNTYFPDLIFVDIDFNCGINGFDLTRAIKFEHPEIIVAILSQYDIPEYRVAAQQNGADFFLSKSSSLVCILDCVDSVVVSRLSSH